MKPSEFFDRHFAERDWEEELDKRFIDKEELKKLAIGDKAKMLDLNGEEYVVFKKKDLDTLGVEDDFVLDEYQEEQLKQKEAKE